MKMHKAFLGIDTSNYTSSCALYIPETDSFISKKQLLPVEQGKQGLRQSDAVFHHTKNLPPLLSELLSEFQGDIECVSYSFAPRDENESYMPCFLVGEGFGKVLSVSYRAGLCRFSHQAGHISAALHSSGMTELTEKKFIAFHVSGGTTDLLLVEPSKENIFNITRIAASLDLKAGQAVDRVGVMLGMGFPAGAELDRLSSESKKEFKIKPYIKDGNVSFSGIENKCRQMLDSGEEPCDIAKYCIDYIAAAIEKMTEYALLKNGDLPLIYAGGVMSNSTVRERMSVKFGGHFASPYFSSDNAMGTAYLGYLKETRNV